MSRSLLVAGLQTAGIPNDPDVTLAQFAQRVRSLKSLFDGAQLVLAPELHLMARDRRRPQILRGETPDAVSIPSGCRFHPRCPVAIDACPTIDPRLGRPREALSPDHEAACILVTE